MENHDVTRQGMDPIDEASETLFYNRRRGCFSFPCFHGTADSSGRGDETSWWRKMGGDALWERGIDALKTIREWSELLAGPRWKTFIRRFNRNRGSAGKNANYQYDPLSYAMNFDEGYMGEESDDGYYSRNFSSRYAKGTLDLPKTPKTETSLSLG